MKPERVNCSSSLASTLKRSAHPSRLRPTFDNSFDPPPVPIPLSPKLSDVVAEARELAMRLGFDDSAGTEHLLSGLAIVDATIAEFFSRFGLNAPGLQERLFQQAGIPAKPIVPEFEIRWAEPTKSDLTDTLRTLDAAANRAREGLRVVEDFVRFSLDDAHFSRLLKELRHELTERLSDLDRFGLIAARDTLGDVGTRIKTPHEQTRLLPIDVVIANCRRVEERSAHSKNFRNYCSATRRPDRPTTSPRIRHSPDRTSPIRNCRHTSNNSATGSTRSKRG